MDVLELCLVVVIALRLLSVQLCPRSLCVHSCCFCCLHTFVQGIHGELGVPSLDSCPSPMHVSGLWEVGVLQVCAGEAHCAVLGANGYAYTWGRGKYGQLGHGSYADQHTPKQVTVDRVAGSLDACCFEI